MKRRGQILIMMMAVAIAGTAVIHAQRGMRGQMPDSAWMRGSGRHMMMENMNMPPDSMRMFMRHHMGEMDMRGGMMAPPMFRPHMGFGMPPGMPWGYGFRGWNGFGPGHFDHPGFGPMAPGFMRIESIPNLTEKQKKDIADLRQKQQQEMQKFREETFAKAKELRETHRKNLMNLLTDEQKKYMEGNTQTAPPAKK